jgi:hypothetical protein
MRKRICQVLMWLWMLETPYAMRPPKAPARTPAPMNAASRVAISFFLYWIPLQQDAITVGVNNMMYSYPERVVENNCLAED